jgi:hypothetical protein
VADADLSLGESILRIMRTSAERDRRVRYLDLRAAAAGGPSLERLRHPISLLRYRVLPAGEEEDGKGVFRATPCAIT